MKIPSFNEANLEQVCNVLGDTNTELTGSDINTVVTVPDSSTIILGGMLTT